MQKRGHPALCVERELSKEPIHPEEDLMTALPQSTRRKLSLPNLAEELGNVSKAPSLPTCVRHRPPGSLV
jgi:hypothetical protein